MGHTAHKDVRTVAMERGLSHGTCLTCCRRRHSTRREAISCGKGTPAPGFVKARSQAVTNNSVSTTRTARARLQSNNETKDKGGDSAQKKLEVLTQENELIRKQLTGDYGAKLGKLMRRGSPSRENLLRVDQLATLFVAQFDVIQANHLISLGLCDAGHFLTITHNAFQFKTLHVLFSLADGWQAKGHPSG